MNETSHVSQIVSKLRFREIKPVINEFNFPYTIIKGEPLSLLAYGKLGQRSSNDIDLLMSKDSTKKASKILEKHGFLRINHSRETEIMMRGFSHQTTPYKKDTGLIHTEIDLNHDILWGEYKGKKISVDDFLSDAVEVLIYNCSTFTLPPMKAFMHLILHQYRDMNSIYLLATRKKLNILAFKDIYYLLKSNSEKIPLQEFYDLCDRFRMIPYIYYVLFFTNVLYTDPLIQLYINTFQTLEGIELLDCYGLSDDERKTWKCDFSTRLKATDLFQLIKSDLTQKDLNKIEYNKKML